uniref:protein artemis n=1 Tax=Myxine glutinosa TaxID=7769 RepID=UPI00358F571B
MSYFSGKLVEYPEFSLDRFDEKNVEAQAFFLSHCHMDHMVGLDSEEFRARLRSKDDVHLYCSPITKDVLLSMKPYQSLEPHVVIIEVNCATPIILTHGLSGKEVVVVVTLIPAAHCPGSVMFLFEGMRGTVLYTGDFRVARGKASCISALHSATQVKNIQSIYVDTTFCDPKLYHIPTREVCVEAIGKLAEEWLSRSRHHIVWLECKSKFGYEFLFVNIAQRLHIKIHVHEDKLQTFANVPEISQHLTTDINTRVHACPSFCKQSRPPCGAVGRVLTIKPTTMWFAMKSQEDLLVKIEDDFYRACYSFHSSYSELRDFVSYFNPVNVYPNVVPPGSTVKEVQERLSSFCHHPKDRGEEIVLRPLGKVQQADHFPSPQPDDFESLFGGIPPPTHRKRVSRAAEKKDSEGSPPPTLPIALHHQENSRVASTSPESTHINNVTAVLAKHPLSHDDDVPKNSSKYQRRLCKLEEHCPKLIDGCE